jgi:hypothetical protein
MEIIDVEDRYKYLVEEINGLVIISRRNDYDLFLLPAFIEDLEGFLKELKELRKLAEDV